MNNYKCKECEKAVIVKDGQIFRICGHDQAGVTVGLSATVIGVAQLESKK